MAIYQGETARIKSAVTDFDGKAVIGGEVSSATVDLYDTSGNFVFTGQTLTWDATGTIEVAGQAVTGYWYHDWQNALVGTFTAKCTFVGSVFTVFDYGTVRVKALKVTPTGVPH